MNNAKDLDSLMLLYILLENSLNYSDMTSSLYIFFNAFLILMLILGILIILILSSIRIY